jgi:hypothetical protein
MIVDSTQPSQDPDLAAPRRIGPFAVLGAVLFGAVIGGVLVEYWLVRRGVATPSAQTAPGGAGGDLAADVAHLKSVLPTQSHTMKDVGDHWVNLWYAVQHKNWPLARFFFDQGRQQIRWTLAIRPERVLPGGGTVNVRGLFTPMDMSSFAALQLTIEDEDTEAFVAAYKETLNGCHSCHTAVRMPFLRPTVPTVPPSSSLSFDPAP